MFLFEMEDMCVKRQKNYISNYQSNTKKRYKIDDICKALACEKQQYNKIPFSVAVIDSGVFPHYGLKKCRNKIIAFKDCVNGKNIPYDDSGHGTAIAGIITGEADDEYCGIAPFVDIVSVKVVDYKNKGNEEDLVKGIRWVIKHAKKYNVKVINISIAVDKKKASKELYKIFEEAIDSGLIIVTSVGNNNGNEKINIPANIVDTISVGSIKYDISSSTEKRIEEFSMSWDDNGKTCPDIYTFGSGIETLKSEKVFKGNVSEKIKNDKGYCTVTGTSFSSAIVTGVVCNILYKYPNLNVKQIKELFYEQGNKIYDDKIKKNVPILKGNYYYEGE